MTSLGLQYYGSTLGLYEQPLQEQARALAFEAEARRRAQPKGQ